MEEKLLDLNPVFDELFCLLRNQKEEVIQGSVELLLDQSETESLVNYVLCNPKTLRTILLLVGNDILHISENSMKILINLSQKSNIVEELCNLSSIEYIMDNLREQIRPSSTVPYHLNLNLMLISNITRYSTGRENFLLKNKQKKNFYLAYLFECLSCPKYKEEQETIINILNNCTSCKKGRNLLFETKLGIEILNKICEILLKSAINNSNSSEILLNIITHICIDLDLHSTIANEDCNVIPTICCLIYPDEQNSYLRIRKSKNILGEIQNKTLFFESNDEKLSLINVDSLKYTENTRTNSENSEIEVNNEGESNNSSKFSQVSPYILKNAVGPVKSIISQDVFDCILVLLSTVEGRKSLRKQGGYEILRIWHLYENKQEIIAGIENIVHLLVYSEEELHQQDIEFAICQQTS